MELESLGAFSRASDVDLTLVFSFLDARSLLTLEMVDKRCRRLAQTDHLWRSLATNMNVAVKNKRWRECVLESVGRPPRVGLLGLNWTDWAMLGLLVVNVCDVASDVWIASRFALNEEYN